VLDMVSLFKFTATEQNASNNVVSLWVVGASGSSAPPLQKDQEPCLKLSPSHPSAYSYS
jgi:hypothetical protein